MVLLLIPGAADSPDYALRPAGIQNTARAHWSTPHGERIAAVPTPRPRESRPDHHHRRGRRRHLTGPIPDSRESTVLAVTSACGVWALAAGAVLLSTALTHRLFTRNRLRRWEQDWNSSKYHRENPASAGSGTPPGSPQRVSL
ncbi:hypothetical protein [Rhodococcus opacus]|uniref:hypothetical protein n=1 Tax=Rhodococcus opacus TaxID=37919 RepID=UPI00130DA4E5